MDKILGKKLLGSRLWRNVTDTHLNQVIKSISDTSNGTNYYAPLMCHTDVSTTWPVCAALTEMFT